MKRSSGSEQAGKKKVRWQQSSYGTLVPGMRGLMVSCVRGREQQCAKEMLGLLNDYVAKLYPNASNDKTAASSATSSSPVESIEDAIARELAELQEHDQKESKQMQQLQLFPKMADCMLFIRTRAPVDPVQITTAIMADILNNGQKNTRVTERVHPLAFSCNADIEAISTMAKQYLSEAIKPSEAPEGSSGEDAEVKPKTYKVMPKIRLNTTVNRDELIKAIARAVPSHAQVDLIDPDYAIIVEVFKGVCGISVLTNYNNYQRYNMQMLFSKASSSDAKQAADSNDNND
ncbi:hypothetical protein GQ42DRAFT_171947 [Ramicandelaber brevisporus]|nr:hypothetical protein GQ42DRAFT_171947 [Ramicandelaber brevisporus]